MRLFPKLLPALILLAATQSSVGQTISQALNKRLDAFKKQLDQERVFVIADKDIYAPGEKIWITAIVYDLLSPTIAASDGEVVVGLYNNSDDEVFTYKLPRVGGIATGNLSIPNHLADDVYYLQAATVASGLRSNYFKKVIIKAKPIPPFIVETTIADQVFKPGEEFSLQLSVRDFYNEPIKNIDFAVELYDGKNKLHGLTGKIKKEAQVDLKIKVPIILTSGLLNYKIIANSKGREAILTGSINTYPNKVNIALFPENGRLINDIPATVRFFVYDNAGRPIQAEGAFIARNERLIALKTNSRGMGTLTFMPTAGAEYAIQLDLPNVEGTLVNLPKVDSKGMALSVTKISDNTVSVKITSSYPSVTPAILIGECNGKIVHFSELKITKEEKVNIDISNARDAMLQFVLANVSAEIESAQTLYTGTIPEAGILEPKVEKNTIGGKMAFEANLDSGSVIISAVNQPWIHDNLSNQKPWIVALPYDLITQPVFQSETFMRGISSAELMQQYMAYYISDFFGWDKILNTKAPFVAGKMPRLVLENRKLLDKILLNSSEITRDNQIVCSNLNASAYFATSNPQYLQSLYGEKTEVIPSYKKMLMSGTQLPDVIQNIRAYKMEGTNIVFVGHTNSLSFQGGALIVIDGVNRGSDASILSGISPFDVDRIFVSTNPVDIHKYTGLNSMGVIEIWLKKSQVGYTSKEVVAPEETDFRSIDQANATDGTDNDFRSTLHWNTSSVVEGTNWNQQYYNSDLLSGVKVVVYVIPNTGKPQEYRAEYKTELK